jgi:hypothetical protein
MPQVLGVQPVNETVTIANGATASSTIDCRKQQLVGFYTPAALTGTTWSLQSSHDGTNFFTALDEGESYSKTMAASRYISVKPGLTAGMQYVKIVSGSAEGDERSLVIIKRPVG